MNLKNMYFIVLVISIVLLSISSVNASLFDDIFDESPKNITVCNLTFNIPEDYSVEESLSINNKNITTNGISTIINSKFFFDKGDNDSFSITIYDFGEKISLDYFKENNMTEKTIKSKNGLYVEEHNSYEFSYIQDNKLVEIYCDGDNVINEVII